MPNYISRNEAAVRIGRAMSGKAKALSLASLAKLVEQGKIIQHSEPTLGGKLMRHKIDAESVEDFIKTVRPEPWQSGGVPRLEGKVAIVTGGGQGIGRSYALRLASEGSAVVVADIESEAAKRVAAEIERRGGKALALHTDVAGEESTLEMARATVQRFGRIDVLVNNAALFIPLLPNKPFMAIPTQEWDQVMAVNLRGLFLCVKAVFPHMKAQGKGSIINISSATVWDGTPGFLHYVTSKGGVIGFTRALAREMGEYGIKVNAVTPGLTETERLTGPSQDAQMDRLASLRCFKRRQRPEDLVGTIVFLASDDSDFITGQAINVDGGRMMH
ncbi:MAG TPA: 3-oxoacyl-ACP reductase family protein [Dehalococcoidia bacterium]|nr:3-oxoacyl-ACP reductase family protein [Dehalococcoidia bacterium]